MKKEENLSDKMNLIHCDQCGCNKYTCFSQEDVKDFIKKLRKRFCSSEEYKCNCSRCRFINKLAGDRLI